MSLKRFYQKSGYKGTIQALLHDKPFIRGMKRESMHNQMIELIAQMELCRLNNGYSERLCHQAYHCIGVPFCAKKEN